MGLGSLKKTTYNLAKREFPDVFRTWRYQILPHFLDIINTKRGGWLIALLTLIVFFIGQYFKPSLLRIIKLDNQSAKIIIDQRISNLATIFSLTLVVIGWLYTHIAIKESLSYKLLFRRTYLYPVIYFISSLISILILFSLFRDNVGINLGDIVICATYLIIIAIFSIGVLFFRLTDVVDTKFFFDSLKNVVLKEAQRYSKKEIISKLSEKIYCQSLDQIGIKKGISFNTDLQNHWGIAVSNEKESKPNVSDGLESIFIPENKYMIADINITSLSALLSKKKLKEINYYSVLNIGHGIPSEYYPIYLHNSNTLTPKEKIKFKRCYKLKPKTTIELAERTYLEYLNSKLLKEVKDGKMDNIEEILEIYSKMYELENRIRKITN